MAFIQRFLLSSVPSSPFTSKYINTILPALDAGFPSKKQQRERAWTLNTRSQLNLNPEPFGYQYVSALPLHFFYWTVLSQLFWVDSAGRSSRPHLGTDKGMGTKKPSQHRGVKRISRVHSSCCSTLWYQYARCCYHSGQSHLSSQERCIFQKLTWKKKEQKDHPAEQQQKRKRRAPVMRQCDHCKMLKNCYRRGPAHRLKRRTSHLSQMNDKRMHRGLTIFFLFSYSRLCNACGLSFTRCKKKHRGAAAMAVSFLVN